MIEDQKDVTLADGADSGPSANNETHATLVTDDRVDGPINAGDAPSLSHSSDVNEQSQVIYVELAEPFQHVEHLMKESPFKAATNLALANLKTFLLKEGLKREESSFRDVLDVDLDRSRYRTLYFRPDVNVNFVCQKLNEWPQVKHAFPAKKVIPPSTVPGDPFKEQLLGLSNGLGPEPGKLDHQWYIFRCGINLAWEANKQNGLITGKGVVLADIDWGFMTRHQEFRNGRIKVAYNTTNPTDRTNVSQGDDLHHGTAVLGIAGATAGDGLGIVGVAFGADLWAIQAGVLPESMVIEHWLEAIQFVCMEGNQTQRKVIMLEVQTEDEENIEAHPLIRPIIKYAIDRGVVVCIAAGNGDKDAGADVKGNVFTATDAIVVGATKFHDVENPIHERSNDGDRVTIYAPGDEKRDVTCSSQAFHKYTNKFGRTSGATPKVAGTVALMLEANPKLTPIQVRDILRETGSQINATTEKSAGIFLNAGAAVSKALSLV